jgi:RecA/RadA recombinase
LNPLTVTTAYFLQSHLRVAAEAADIKEVFILQKLVAQEAAEHITVLIRLVRLALQIRALLVVMDLAAAMTRAAEAAAREQSE